MSANAFNVVGGVDPAAAWALWGYTGPLAMGQGRTLRDAGRDMRLAMESVGIPQLRRLYGSAVERPHGTHSGAIQTLIVECLTTGWWLRELEHKSLVQWNPTAGMWRRYLGIKGHRKAAKRQAVDLMTEIAKMARVDLPRNKKGNPAIDAIEACCIALASWIGWGLVVPGDMASEVIKRFGLPYAGKATIADNNRQFNTHHSVTFREDQVLAKIEDEIFPAIPEGGHDPWSAGPPTESEDEVREADAPDDDG